MKTPAAPAVREVREQYSVLKEIEARLEIPMLVLSLLWAALLVVDLTWGLGPWLQATSTGIWFLFVVDFGVRIVIAPKRLSFVRKNWIVVVALMLPALRIFRVARAVRLLRAGRAVRGVTLAKVLTAFQRGVRSLRTTLSWFGLSYVLGMTGLVTALGTAGTVYFERQVAGGISDWGDSLWYTVMLLTTIGCEFWPKTPEGRFLSFLISLYAFAAFGYLTATLAAWLMGRANAPTPATAESDSIASLRDEIARLRLSLEGYSREGGSSSRGRKSSARNGHISESSAGDQTNLQRGGGDSDKHGKQPTEHASRRSGRKSARRRSER